VAFVCLLEIELHFPENGSLKGKRRELSSLKAQLQRRFGAAVAETEHHDLWQRAGLTAALVGKEARLLKDRAAEVERYVWGVFPDGASVESQLISTEDLRAAMEGLLDAKEVEEAVGTAEVRATFKASRVGTIAGSYVTDGIMRRGVQCRLVRDGTVVYDGRIGSLRRFKDDVREVTAGMECGIVLENYPDPKEGDVIEAYEIKQVEQTLS
jgi:translation initiation factor IF-2